MRNIFKLLLTVLLFCSTQAIAQFGPDAQLVEFETFKSLDNIHAGSELKIALKVHISETWHINSNKPNEDYLIGTELAINSNKVNVAAISYPKPLDLKFSFSDVPLSVYEEEIFVGAILNIPEGLEVGKYEIPVELTYQACNDITCMPPNSVIDTIVINVVNTSEAVTEINSEIFSKIDLSFDNIEVESSEEDSLAKTIQESGLFFGLIIVFLGGLALNLTPCVYPLIPITIGFFGGQSEGRTSRLFLLGVLYVLGIALTYSIVGVVTSLSGAVFGALLQNPIVIFSVVGILIALSLSMFGLYELKMPDSWVMKAGGAQSGALGAFIMGLTMGIVAAPCIGPFVLGLVTVVAQKGDPVYGFFMFFTLAVGLGTPYLFLALFSGKIKNLPRAGFWMEAVKHIFGVILVWMAIYFLSPMLPKEIGVYLLPVFMILGAIYLLFFDKAANKEKGFRIFKTVFSVVVIAVAAWMMWPVDKKAPAWGKYSNEVYETSLASGKPILIDFYADWCIPCKELDALTFSKQRVIDETKRFDTYKVDMTKTLSETTEQIRQKFKIRGMPTILFIDKTGKEVKRITGFIDADEMLELLKKVK